MERSNQEGKQLFKRFPNKYQFNYPSNINIGFKKKN